MSLGDLFIDGLVKAFRYHQDMAERAVAQVPDDKLHVALDANTNSIAVIMKHVAGNLRSRWTDFLSSDGEKPWRDRDSEFSGELRSRAEIMQHWEQGWAALWATLTALHAEELTQTGTIRGEPHSVPLAAQRSLAHTSYHVGQIVLLARVHAGDDWQVLTIPRGGTAEHNRRTWGESRYQGAGGT